MSNKIIEITPEAQEIATHDQWKRLAVLLNGANKIHVSVKRALLPDGYIAVIMTYHTGVIHGGIDPEGVLST